MVELRAPSLDDESLQWDPATAKVATSQGRADLTALRADEDIGNCYDAG